MNCLNFGNPEHPDVMWQFVEVTEGMSEACEALDVPVVGGNVSFYNESRGADIDPTPVVGLVGVVDELTTVPPPAALAVGSSIVVLGSTHTEVGGSEWASWHGLRDGMPPAVVLPAARALHELVAALVRERVVGGVHDCSDGGLAVALAEMAIAGGCGFRVELPAAAPGVPALVVPALGWFSESTSRVVLAVADEHVDGVLARTEAAGVPAAAIGTAGGDRLGSADFDVALADADDAWRNAIPRALGHQNSRAVGDT